LPTAAIAGNTMILRAQPNHRSPNGKCLPWRAGKVPLDGRRAYEI